MKNAKWVGIVTVLVVGVGIVFMSAKTAEQPLVEVNNTRIPVEIVETPEAQAQGLSGRESLPRNSGMLFILSEPRTPSFWMKDMRFAIDIIWISEEKKIVGIERNVSPDTYPQTFSPAVPARYVLEVNGGLATQHSIKQGDSVAF